MHHTAGDIETMKVSMYAFNNTVCSLQDTAAAAAAFVAEQIETIISIEILSPKWVNSCINRKSSEALFKTNRMSNEIGRAHV